MFFFLRSYLHIIIDIYLQLFTYVTFSHVKYERRIIFLKKKTVSITFWNEL